MAFSRTKYDQCQYEQQIKRSTDVGSYRLYAPANESCTQCYSLTGPIGSRADVSVPRNNNDLDLGLKADAESHLTNRVLQSNQCNDKGKNDSYKSLSDKMTHLNNCQSKLNTVDTRFTHPIDAYRGMNTTEYSFNPHLHVNPQCNIQEWRSGTNSRLIAKDTYVMPEQKLLDNGGALPTPAPKPKIETSKGSSCQVCK